MNSQQFIKIILSNCPINNGNRGCVALSVSTMFILGKVLNDRGISHVFYLPQSGFDKYEEHTMQFGDVQIKFVSIMDITPLSLKKRIKNMVYFVLRNKEYLAAKKAYKEADFIFDIGQGDSFADIYGKERFEWIFGQYKLGMKYKKPYCILPQTIGPYNSEAIRKQACAGIDYAKCVMARDKQSYDYVKELLPSKEVTEIIDIAFFMPYVHKYFDKRFIHVGLNVSALLWHGGYTRDNQFGLKVDYPALVKSIIDYFLAMDNVKVHLIPHVVGSERHVENDYAVSYDLWEEYSNESLVLAPLFLDPIAAKAYISGMDFFMGARMHATIGAFSAGVPVVPMAYSRKFNGLFADTLLYPHMVDMKAQTNEEALESIERAYINRNALKETIDEQMRTTVAERGKLMKEELCTFLGI